MSGRTDMELLRDADRLSGVRLERYEEGWFVTMGATRMWGPYPTLKRALNAAVCDAAMDAEERG
ncbi:MAG: hypothetical protein ABF558_05660 [Gluconobacter sp.]|uniref:hypothetical protein n=1 Tax=Gluconobacter sp. P5B12 TaxID=2762618 RepID=UPI001C03AEC9|nr:hypothetical protein [Gluconobacter sp. P5B12]